MDKEQDNEIILKYDHILDMLVNRSEYSEAADHAFQAAGFTSAPQIESREYSKHECAKAFFIHLARAAFSGDSDTDIALMAMALLKGYEDALGRQARRYKYLYESNYHTAMNSGGARNKDLSPEALNAKAKQFNKTDYPKLREMFVFFDGIEDKVSFFKEACSLYLKWTTDNHYLRAILPFPSYELATIKPIIIIPPIANPDFCGRDECMAEIEDCFKEKTSRSVLMLYGLDGVGKTQLAVQYAEKHRHDYSAIIWIDATSVSSMEDDCKRILTAYSEDDPFKGFKQKGTEPEPDDVAQAFNTFISDRPNALIVFDNADYLDESTAGGKTAAYYLRQFVPSGNSHVIITTHCAGIFDGVRYLAVDALDQKLASELLIKKAGAEPDQYIEELAEKLGCLPLAVEYAGAYIKKTGITYGEYLDKWDRVGAKVFDQMRTEMPVRKAFGITLEKIKAIPWAMELLKLLAELGVTTLPLEEYVNMQLEAINESAESKLHIPQFIVPDENSGSSEEVYRIVEIRGDGSYLTEGPEGEQKVFVNSNVELFKVLSDEDTRDRLLFALEDYSLITCYDDIVTVNPMLTEIVFDEYYHESRAKWIEKHTPHETLYDMYVRIGDKENARKELCECICEKIEKLKYILESYAECVNHPQEDGWQNYDYESKLLDAYKLVLFAKMYGDETYIAECDELRRELIKVVANNRELFFDEPAYDELRKMLFDPASPELPINEKNK